MFELKPFNQKARKMSSTVPSTMLAPLDRADGSAAYSYNGFSIIGGVNGPVEVQRRDELPEEAAIDVVVRPVTGVGGILVNLPHSSTVIPN